MANDLMLRRQDLITNPTSRVPICLVLDCSPSMSGEVSMGSVVQQTTPRPIDELNEGIRLFFSALQDDEVARYSAEVSIVGFSAIAQQLLDFDSITRVHAPTVELNLQNGGTSIGAGVDLALTLLQRRKDEYRDAGVDYFQPWLVLMTDGRPTDDSHIAASRKLADLVNRRKATVFPIAIGDGADMNILAMFSPKREPLRLKGIRFREFFEWLSHSVCATSQSVPGETIPLDVNGIRGWSDLN